MSRAKIIFFVLLIFVVFIRPVQAIFVTDIIAYSKMALEYSKHLKALKQILETSKKLKDDFEEFKGKFAKIHSGLKKEALSRLLNFKDIEFYFNSPYVRISKDDPWKNVWNNTKELFKKLPFLKNNTQLTDNKLYSKSRKFRKRADYRIKREEEIYKEYENVLSMIAGTRKVISEGSKKYKNIEKLIRKFSGQRSTGKLIGLLCELKLEQLVKLDLLITSMRMEMELYLKEKIIKMDLAKKREIEIHEDSKRIKIEMEKVL